VITLTSLNCIFVLRSAVLKPAKTGLVLFQVTACFFDPVLISKVASSIFPAFSTTTNLLFCLAVLHAKGDFEKNIKKNIYSMMIVQYSTAF
jgi:hypothetical protein